MVLCPKDDFTFTFPRGFIWKIDNLSTTLSLAPGKFDNPYKAGSRRNYHEKSTSIFGPDATKPQKTRELPRKINIEEVEPPKKPKRYEFYCGNPVQEHPRTTKRRKLPRKVNIEELEEPKKYENYCAKPVSDPFKSTADQRKARELPR